MPPVEERVGEREVTDNKGLSQHFSIHRKPIDELLSKALVNAPDAAPSKPTEFDRILALPDKEERKKELNQLVRAHRYGSFVKP